jgi:hypothetical protein
LGVKPHLERRSAFQRFAGRLVGISALQFVRAKAEGPTSEGPKLAGTRLVGMRAEERSPKGVARC